MAKVLSLPVVFICENNFYAEFTPLAAATAGANIAARAARIRHPGGTSSTATTCGPCTAPPPMPSSAPATAAARRCSSARPTVTTATPRAIPAPYRPKGELERWLERDPLKLARARLIDDGVSEARILAVEEEITATMEQAVETRQGRSVSGSADRRGHGVPVMSTLEFRDRDPRRDRRGAGPRSRGDVLRRGRRRGRRRVQGDA